MSTAQLIEHDVFIPPPYDTPHVIRQFDEIMAEVSEVIAPVWPLKDYVAVNPYAGVSHRSFMDARAFFKVFSDCETLMPVEYYATEFHEGRFDAQDIKTAIAELRSLGVALKMSESEIAKKLMTIGPVKSKLDQPTASANHDRPLKTIAEYATTNLSIDWSEAIVEEISKHCAAHYDEGQSTWSSPQQNVSLYQAWRTVAERDCNIEILGLQGFRKYVSHLPHTPEAAIVQSLEELQVPQQLWSSFLLCQAFSIPGWCAWTKYQTSWSDAGCEDRDDLIGLLAMRLAYDAALANAKSLSLNWTSLLENRSVSFKSPWTSPGDNSILRYTLLRASEIGFRNGLLSSLSLADESVTDSKDQKLAQMVFCIDVRSERIRRQLEAQSSDIETFGFAGFFGMPIEFVPLGQSAGNSHLPVLLKPKFQVHEHFTTDETKAIQSRQDTRSWRRLWKGFQTSAIGCFLFVETTGVFFGVKLLQRVLGYKPNTVNPKYDGLSQSEHAHLRPSLDGLEQQGVNTDQQANMVESMLRNLSLTKDFAKLVVLCGHACQTDNNPLAAGLDCGACGGHSGEPNARFAVALLNQSVIRTEMAKRGIQIPDATHFLGALHNTTTDFIEFFDTADIPVNSQGAFQELVSSCAAASQQTQAERLPVVASSTISDLLKRASDWSEVRPEWGLAGNAAFIVAPRSVTKNAKLDARSFLHSYDYTQDTEGKVLETIMTAPMVVAHWINMQYYASTVDNHHFGSGSKTVHNVVGKFGILSGNGGDLMTGLPWQSLHTGENYQHLPMRLQVVIAAPREMIDTVIAKHVLVANLLNGSWLHLVAIENDVLYRLCDDGNWEVIEVF